MFWIDSKRGHFTDWLSQRWVQICGCSVNPADYPWLYGATGATRKIGLDAFEKFTQINGLKQVKNKVSKGILPNFNTLSSATFNPHKIHSSVVHFYQNTSDYSVQLSAEWCSLFQPGGWLLSKLFSKRLQQLNIPLSNTEAGQEITSDIQNWLNPDSGELELTLWLRSFKESGVVAYSGSYSTCFLESIQSQCIQVIFPLPNGRAVVIFRPEVTESGGLHLVSSGNKMGEPGFYFVVESGDKYFVKYVQSFQESITVYPGTHEQIKAEHHVSLWGINFLRMHYNMMCSQKDVIKH